MIGPAASTSRSSRREATESIRLHIVDLRLEKVFSAGFNRFGVYADMENLFNVGTAITAQNRFPERDDFGEHRALRLATAVTPARQVTFGARWSF